MKVGADRISETTGPAVVRFPAEVDLSNGDLLLTEALRRLREGAPALVMDLGGCSFCDSSGPNAIFRAKVRADAMGVPLLVVLPRTGLVRRICDIAGVTRRVPTASDMESALAMLAVPAKPGPVAAETAPLNTPPARPMPSGNGRHGPGGGRRAS
ncbi:hypothetical protein GCM10010191_61620 [Actinomadura vinacea]|uniref:STAS domain-containing protein n=1 Tax=Actinomadura vinacea TaxID=115336 RepID=A0ABN3JU92_9ACTN